MWKIELINNRYCHVYNWGDDGPIFVWLYYPHRGNELEHLAEVLAQQVHHKDFNYTIIACEVTDWNRDLSPWQASNMDGSMFEGAGPRTLEWVQSDLIPWMKLQYPNVSQYVMMGYSLAGLFALWSVYELPDLAGALCCSGSLWIDGWTEYVSSHEIAEGCSVYLSLGGKEEKTKNVLMAKVGDRTRAQEKLLKADKQVKNCILEWNSGGHFADSQKRMAKGIMWMLKVLKEEK